MKAAVVIIFCAVTMLILGCAKYVDKPGATDPRLSRPYCNDPLAVNYNWNFPGTPDNTTCFYPAPSYIGHYVFVDSIYNAGSSFLGQQSKSFNCYSLNYTNMVMVGFCGGADTLHFTVDRTLKATVDTIINNGVNFGQLLCRQQDTVNGYIQRPLGDSAIQFYFTVVSDTGITLHMGTAYKQ